MRVIVLITVAGMALQACGGGSGSGSNPFGSFGSIGSIGSGGSFGSGGSRADETGGGAAELPVDESDVVESIDTAVLEPSLRGTVLRVTSTAPTQGWYDARLAPLDRGEPDEDGRLRYEMRAVAPTAAEATGPARTRQLVVATYIPDDVLAAASSVRVISRGKVVDLRIPR